MKFFIFFIFFNLSISLAHALDVTKTIKASFIGNLSSPELVAVDDTVMTQPCSSSSQGDCYFFYGGKKINGFSLGGVDRNDVTALKGIPNGLSARFDTTPRAIDVINESGRVAKVYLRIIGIGFQLNGAYDGGIFYKFDRIIAYPNGSPWPNNAQVDLVAGGDCSSIGTYHYVTGAAFRTFWRTAKREGMANCYATNAMWSNVANAISAYQAIGPYFLYELTTDKVTSLEPGMYKSKSPVVYSIGAGKDIEPFSGVSGTQPGYARVPERVNINIELFIQHSIYVSNLVNKLKLYPDSSLSWERWGKIRTPLKNDIHFRFASTGPIRLSVFCKDAYTQEGNCALLRRQPSNSIEPGAVDSSDEKKYGIDIRLNLSGFINYFTKESIQSYLLIPSTSPIGATPSSSITIEPITTVPQPGSINISTSPGVSETMAPGRTYSGTITLVVEPGSI